MMSLIHIKQKIKWCTIYVNVSVCMCVYVYANLSSAFQEESAIYGRTRDSLWEISLPESVSFQHLTGEVSDLLAMDTVIIGCGDSHSWLSTIEHPDWTVKQTSVHIYVVSSLNLLKKKNSLKEWVAPSQGLVSWLKERGEGELSTSIQRSASWHFAVWPSISGAP